jgi:hypothetical protein
MRRAEGRSVGLQHLAAPGCLDRRHIDRGHDPPRPAAASRRHGPPKSIAASHKSSATPTISPWRMSTSNRSRADALRRISRPRMKRERSQPTLPSCRSCCDRPQNKNRRTAKLGVVGQLEAGHARTSLLPHHGPSRGNRLRGCQGCISATIMEAVRRMRAVIDAAEASLRPRSLRTDRSALS